MKIKINDKYWRADMTMGAALYLKQIFDKEVEDITNTTSDYLKYVYCCVKSCAYVDGEDFGLDFEAFCNSMDSQSFNEWFYDFLQSNEASRTEIEKMAAEFLTKKKPA